MSTTSPLLQNRAAQPCIAIPLTVSGAELGETWPEIFEVTTWARQHGLEAHGAPFPRYRTTVDDASGRLAVEVGLPVAPGSNERLAADLAADPRLRDGVLPPGTYATLVHTGSYTGLRVVRASTDLAELTAQQDEFYGSTAWREGPREALVPRIESYVDTLLWLTQSSIDDLRAGNG